MAYYRPATLQQGLDLLAQRRLTVLAGATALGSAEVEQTMSERYLPTDLLDITAMNELRGITQQGDHYRIGALTTWTDLLRSPLPAPFAGLGDAARQMGSVQIRNRATLMGNVCNAAPGADGVPILLGLNAAVELAARDSKRVLRLADFVIGPRRTAIRPGEIATALLVPAPTDSTCSVFQKLGIRRRLAVAVVTVAIVVDFDKAGVISDARIAVGSCSTVAQRLIALERLLKGKRLTAEIESYVYEAQLSELAPGDDVRADAGYRRHAALELIRRLLRQIAARPRV